MTSAQDIEHTKHIAPAGSSASVVGFITKGLSSSLTDDGEGDSDDKMIDPLSFPSDVLECCELFLSSCVTENKKNKIEDTL